MIRPEQFVYQIPEVTSHLVAVSEQDPQRLARIETFSIPGEESSGQQALVGIRFDEAGVLLRSMSVDSATEDLLALRGHQSARIAGTKYDAMCMQQTSFDRGLGAMVRLADRNLSLLDRARRRELGAAALDFTRRGIRVSTFSKVATTDSGYNRTTLVNHAAHIPAHAADYRALLPFADRRMRKWTRSFLQ